MNKEKKNIFESNKKYGIWDYIRIPMKATPICTLIIGINRIISSFIPAITVLLTANFVNAAIGIFNKELDKSSIIMPIFWIVLMVVYTNLNYTLIYGFVNIRYDMAVFRTVRAELTEKRSKLEYKHIEDNDTWDLISRATDNSLVGIAIGMNNLFDILELFISIGSILIILTTQVWWVGLVIFALSIPLIMVALKSGEAIYDSEREVRKHMRRYQYYQEVLSKRDFIEERAMFGYSKKINDKWLEQYEVSRKHIVKVGIKEQIKMRISSIVALLVSLGIIGFLLIPASKGQISSGMFIALTIATFNIVSTMSWRLNYIARTFAEKKEYLKDLTAFMALSEKEGSIDMPLPTSDISFEKIEFKNVSFKYPGTEKYILKDFNLVLEKNLHYAFVGINGAGKTTITKLLTGLYDNFEGEILIDNKSIKEYKQAFLKAMFSVVYQDFARFQIKAKDNIMLGDVLELDEVINNNKSSIEADTRIKEVLTEINLDKVIEKLDNGLETFLGKITKGGVDLSGGQWQRLAVARALYNPALVRILDEPTAALDPVAESNVYKMFGRISKGKTTIFITHRLGAAKLADKIIVLDEGKVAQIGNHEDLVNKKGIYSNMFESQKSWYESKKEGGVVVE